ncbi:MAG TPA: lysylphosphatidylglycerol synthase transmembrane domain-containing protein [Vicinamibacterales bacterium]|nr:lysylphosphatidylglycerol synthase transmembrane domain-containing protein [Vicinamibacterales bacterium]
MTHFLRGLVDALTHARLSLVALAIALHFGGLVITGERWRVVIAGLGSRLSLTRTVLINLAGIFVRNTTPTTGLGGDASRIALMRADGVPLAQATASFAYVRLAELPPLAAVVLLSAPVAVMVALRSRRWAIVTVTVVALALALAWLKRSTLRARLDGLWQRTAHLRIGWRVAAAAIAFATLAQVETIARQIVIAGAFGLWLTPQQAAAVTVMGIVGGFVPTVGSVGAIDGSLVGGLMLCGASAQTAVAITVVERGISYALTTAVGGAALAILGGRRVMRAVSAQ